VKSPTLKPLYDEAIKRLSKFTEWNIQHVRRDKNQRADELANLAMDHQADVTADTPPASSHPPSDIHHPASTPCWSAKLTGKNGKCIAGCSTRNEYTFGPTTPDGFCVHAAQAMLNDGPLLWDAKKRSGKSRCPACGLSIQINIIHRG
jgi:Reverse transcriptase-like